MNNIIDYAALLLSGYLPLKKSYDNNRRRFNPGNPNEFECVPAPVNTASREENLIAAAVDDNGVPLYADNAITASGDKKVPAPIHIF
jgi:hypothetical protein